MREKWRMMYLNYTLFGCFPFKPITMLSESDDDVKRCTTYVALEETLFFIIKLLSFRCPFAQIVSEILLNEYSSRSCQPAIQFIKYQRIKIRILNYGFSVTKTEVIWSHSSVLNYAIDCLLNIFSVKQQIARLKQNLKLFKINTNVQMLVNMSLGFYESQTLKILSFYNIFYNKYRIYPETTYERISVCEFWCLIYFFNIQR